MRSLLLLVALSIPSVYQGVEAAAHLVQCDGICEDRFDGSCDDVVSDFNFQGDCCTLSANGNDGCILTVEKGSCSVSDRIIPCGVKYAEVEDVWYTQCTGNFMVTYDANTTEEVECSESKYEVKNWSEVGMANGWTMEVKGVEYLDGKSAVVWKTLMEKHTLDFASGHMGDSVSDVQTYIHPFALKDTNITADDDGVLRLGYFQYLTWRNVVNFTGTEDFMEQVYLSDEGLQMILAAFQEENSNITSIAFIAPPSMETGAPTLTETMDASSAATTSEDYGTAVSKSGPGRTDDKGSSGTLFQNGDNGMASAALSRAFEWTLLIVTLSAMALA
jgi:hypothetical protein